MLTPFEIFIIVAIIALVVVLLIYIFRKGSSFDGGSVFDFDWHSSDGGSGGDD